MIDTAALREKVLDLAIRGKLVPQDPNDEPASVLLERIRQQKQQMVKDGKLKPKDIKGDTVIFVGDDNLHYEKFADGIVKCIEDEIPFDLPDNWAWVRLQSISSMANGTAKRKGSEGTETIVLRLADLGETEISFTNTRQVVLTDGEIQKYALSVGDVLFVRVNGSKENVGKSYCYDNESFPIAYCDHLIRCTPTGALCGKLLSIFMRCGYVRQLIGERTVSAAGQHTISQPSLASILLPVPPLKEQDRIIYRLNRTDSYISQISNSKQELAEIVLHAKAKILDLAIRGKLTPQDPSDEPASVLLERIRAEKEELIRQGKIKRDKKESVIFRGDDNSYYEKIDGFTVCIDEKIPFALPDNWRWERLGNISTIARGGSPRPIEDYITESEDGINWIKIGDTEQGGKYISSTREKIIPAGLSKTRYVKSGDFLLTNSMSFGRPYILKTDGCIHDGWLVIGGIENIFNQDYLYYTLSSGFMYKAFSEVAAGSTVKNLKSDTVRAVFFPVPPYSEQVRIANCVEMLFATIASIEKSLT